MSMYTPINNPANAAPVPKDKISNNMSVYKVIPDASETLEPFIEPVSSSSFTNIISLKKSPKPTARGGSGSIGSSSVGSNGGVVWLGEHHNSKADHDLQAHMIQEIYNQQMMKQGSKKTGHNMSIGLEQIQIQFQPYLDAYVDGSITEKEMLEGVQWSTRWQWSYDNYRPVFELARNLRIPLIALNVNSEDLGLVEINGLRGLSKEQLKEYIPEDAKGFGDFISQASYKSYNTYVIEPSYQLHKDMGILRRTITGNVLDEDMSYANFFWGRILWDESMASHAHRWTKRNPGGIMVGLIGADHVKFEKGVVGRYKRLVDKNVEKELQLSSTSGSAAPATAAQRDCVAVLLNPTLIDSRPSGSVGSYMNASSSSFPDQLTLQLRYLKEGLTPTNMDPEERKLPSNTGGVLALADYIVIGS